MHRMLVQLALLAVGMATAAAEPRGTYKWVGDPTGGSPTWQPPPSAAVSHVIYLNNCKPNGCILSPGFDNATTSTSSVPDVQSTVAAYTGSDATWNQVVTCVKQVYSPFDVQIVTERPSSGSYHMAIVAGTPGQVQQGSTVLGVSPFSCSYINNSISFTFANLEPSNVADLCWTIAQETAHSWGLDHKYDNRDPMTYLSGGLTIKQFQNEAGSCGEYSARSCNCSYPLTGSSKMNSYSLIQGVFGSSAPDTVPPTVAITTPAENAQVMPSFPVKADVNDDRIIDKVEFRLDGMVVSTSLESPFSWTAPSTLGQGKHKVEVTAIDRGGNATKATVNVQYGTVCAAASDCDATGNVCLDGHCVAGPSLPHGLGTSCTGNSDCSSMQCGSDGSSSYCVEMCDLAADACPSGFKCTDTGNTAGVCWPSGDDGGCLNAGGGSHPTAFLLLLAVAVLLLTRKRR